MKRITAGFRRLLPTWVLLVTLGVCALIKSDSFAGVPPGGGAGDVTCPVYKPNALPFLGDLGPFETKEAGTLPGTFAVTTSGGATYDLPLLAPPSRAGVEPSLAVHYDSSGGDGVLGEGFSLSGLSVVTQCPKNLAQDQEIQKVSYGPFDPENPGAYCLDGRRLVQVPAPPSAPANVLEYRTFPDTFVRVRAHLPDPADPEGLARGPLFFEVETKAGMTLRLGDASSSLALAKNGLRRGWWISSEHDRYGNTVDFTYDNHQDVVDGHTIEQVPLQIDYTGHRVGNAPQDVAPTRRVLFEWAAKTPEDTRYFYEAGLLLESARLLAKVKMQLLPSQAEVREYRFSYDQGPATQRTLLTSIKECAPDGVCKPPTLFTWNHGGAPGFTQMKTGIARPNAKRASVMPMDVTGGGLADLVIADFDFVDANGEGDPANPVAQWSVRRAVGVNAGVFDVSPAAVTKEPLLPPNFGKANPERGTAIDYNQDGRADILLYDTSGQFADWNVLLAQPDHTFKRIDTGLLHLQSLTGTPVLGPDASAHLADVDGDGVLDLIQCVDNGAGADWTVNLWSPQGPGFDPVSSPIPDLQDYPCTSELHTVDIDADSKVDLVVQGGFGNGQGSVYTGKYIAYTFIAPGKWTGKKLGLPAPPVSSNALTIFVDVNGDGLPDAIEAGAADHHLQAYLNTGDGFVSGNFAISSSTPDFLLLADDNFARLATTLDFNGDGRQDLLIPITYPVGEPLPRWYVLQATGALGEGAFTLVDSGIPFEAALLGDDTITLADPLAPRVIDADGAGRNDVLIPLDGTFRIFKSNLGEEDSLATITDGLNAFNGSPADPGFVPNIRVKYDHLIDRAAITGAASLSAAEWEGLTYIARLNPGNGCDYPRHCVVGPRRVVSGYAQNNGAGGVRTFDLAYRDGRFDRLGRGDLGFGTRLIRESAAGTGSAEWYDNITFDAGLRAFPYAGQLAVARHWSMEDAAGAIDLAYDFVTRETVPTSGGATYFTLPAVATTRRMQGYLTPGAQTALEYTDICSDPGCGAVVLGTMARAITKHDDYGNVLEESTTTEGVNLLDATSRSFTNDVGSWTLGQLDTETECSSVKPLVQCRTTTRTYNAQAQVKTEALASDDGDPETQVKSAFTYDPLFGNLVATTADDAYGGHRSTCTSYETDGIFPYAHRNAVGHLWLSRFDPGLGVETEEIDPNQLHTQWGHDGFGRLAKEQRADGTCTDYTLTRTQAGAQGFVLRAEVAVDHGSDDTVELDGYGRVVRWWSQGVDFGVPAPRITGSIAYDASGEHIAARSVPTVETTPPGEVLYHSYGYDAAGRILQHTSPWKSVTTYVYDGATVQVYGAPKAPLSTIESDALGRPVTVTDAMGGETSYTYGPFGALRTVTSPLGATTHLEHDAYGRVRELVEPDRGGTTVDYNGFGDRTTVTNALWTSSYQQDAIGRTLTRTDSDGAASSTTTWTWDPQHGVGELGAVATAASVKSYTFDTKSRLTTSALSFDGETFLTVFGYDPWSRLSTIIYPAGSDPDGFAVHNEFDEWGHLIGVLRASPNAIGPAYWKLTSTDDAGRIQGEAYGNGVTTTRGYVDGKNRVASILTTGPPAYPKELQHLSYTYDDRLNVKSRADALQGAAGRTETFEYDDLDRLTCAYFDGVPGCAEETKYDADGSFVSRPGLGKYAYKDPAHPHAATATGASGAGAYGYDLLGRQNTRPGADLVTYTAFDLPKQVTLALGAGTVSFEYSGDEARIRKLTPSATTISVDDRYERVTTGGKVEHRYSVSSSERVVAVVTQTAGAKEAAKYVHVDNLGSVDVLTDDTGHDVEHRSYEAWGAQRSAKWGDPAAPPAGKTTEGFTWHEADDELGLVNMKGRLFDPKLGRFLSTDPIVGEPLFSQSWNPYAYTLNNPLAYVDPSGFDETPPSATYYESGGLPTKAEILGDGTTLVTGLSGESKRAPEDQNSANRDALLTGAAPVPVDMASTGMAARVGPPRQPSPPGFDPSAGKGAVEIANEIGHGVWDGVRDLAVEGMEFRPASFFTGWWELAKIARHEGVIGSTKAFFWDPAARQVDIAVAAANEGDFRAATAAGVKAISAGVSAGLTIGHAVGAGVQAVQGATTKPAVIPPTRNGHLAGGAHPVTGVPFDSEGYPDFKAAGLVQKEVQIAQTGTRGGDFRAADKIAGFDETPDKMTWHHHQDGTTMQLVPENVHRQTGHTGGFSLKKRE